MAHGFGGAVGTRHAECQDVTGNEIGQGDGAQAIETGAQRPGQHGRVRRARAPVLPRRDLAHRKGLAGQQGTQQVVDAAFEDGEARATAGLHPHHPGEIDPATGNQKAAGLDHQLAAKPGILLEKPAQPATQRNVIESLLLLGIGHAETTAEVDLIERQPLLLEPAGDRQQAPVVGQQARGIALVTGSESVNASNAHIA